MAYDPRTQGMSGDQTAMQKWALGSAPIGPQRGPALNLAPVNQQLSTKVEGGAAMLSPGTTGDPAQYKKTTYIPGSGQSFVSANNGIDATGVAGETPKSLLQKPLTSRQLQSNIANWQLGPFAKRAPYRPSGFLSADDKLAEARQQASYLTGGV